MESIKLSQAISGQQLDKDNPDGVYNEHDEYPQCHCFRYLWYSHFRHGIGLYWIVSAVVRCVQQVFINKHLSKISVEEILEQE